MSLRREREREAERMRQRQGETERERERGEVRLGCRWVTGEEQEGKRGQGRLSPLRRTGRHDRIYTRC